MKDIVLYRVKAFNPVALTDYVVHVWENYFENRLSDFAHDRRDAPRLKYTQVLERMPQGAADLIEVLDDGIYRVPSATDEGVFYNIKSDIGPCSCQAGIQGRFCKHQVLVQET